MIKRSSVSEDVRNAEALEAHARSRLSTQPWLQQRIPWPVWLLATIGTAFVIGFALAAWWPLMILSYRYYFG